MAGRVLIAIVGVIGPHDEELTVTLASLFFGSVSSVISSIAIAAIAIGLRRSIGPVDAASSRHLLVALVLLVGVVAVAWFSQLLSLDGGEGVVQAMRVASILGGAAAVVHLLAWSSLLVVGVDGRRLGARPRTGWLSVTLASVAVLAGAVVTVGAGSLITESGFPTLGRFGSLLLPTITVLSAAASLLFALAFAAGLPATEPATDATDDPSAATDAGSAGS